MATCHPAVWISLDPGPGQLHPMQSARTPVALVEFSRAGSRACVGVAPLWHLTDPALFLEARSPTTGLTLCIPATCRGVADGLQPDVGPRPQPPRLDSTCCLFAFLTEGNQGSLLVF